MDHIIEWCGSFGFVIDRGEYSAIVLHDASKPSQNRALRALEHRALRWYEYDGVFRKNGVGESYRHVKRAPYQPTHRIRFREDVSARSNKPLLEEEWLVMADRAADGTLFSWTHEEWIQRTDREGAWKCVNGVWLRRGKTTPGSKKGTLEVQEL